MSDKRENLYQENQRNIKVLAVKSVEENSSKIITHMAVSSANISAIGAKSDLEFIQKRASYLFNLLPDSVKYVITLDRFPGIWLSSALLISFLFGLLSNYLGPSQLIHVVYNPLTILLVWNLLVYLFMALKGLARRLIPDVSLKPAGKSDAPEDMEYEQEKEKQTSGWFLNWIIGGIFKGIMQLKARFIDESNRVTIVKKVIPAFLESYRQAAGNSLLYKMKSVLNVSSIGLLLGALVGVYFRGLFFRYNIIWQSTFIDEPQTIVTILNVLFGPAAVILDGSFFTTNDLSGLLSPDGTSAAPWIHKMALMTMLFIFVPRLMLATYFVQKAKTSPVVFDLGNPYYTDRVLKDRESLMEIISDGITEIISKKIKKTGDTISDFVIEDYYEKIISPILLDFRKKGGKLRTLETKLFNSQEEFEPILLRYLEEVQEDFRDTILTEINLFLGRKLDIDINTLSSYQPQSDNIDSRLSNRMAAEIGDTLGSTIVTTVSLAAGAISGGIGQSLGIAIISGLLGVSGPVGLLIGGLATAITLGGVYKLKREQISGMIKDVNLPPFIVSVTLPDSKIEKAKKDTYAHTKNEINKMLEPKIGEVTQTILKDLTY